MSNAKAAVGTKLLVDATGYVTTVTTTSRAGGVGTVNTAAAHGAKTGDTIVIAGCTDASMNTSFAVASTPTAVQLTVSVSGTGSGTGGTLTITTAGAPQPVIEITNLGGPNQKTDTADVSNMDSANSFKEFIATLIDGGEVSVTGNWIADDAYHLAVLYGLQNGLKQSFQITFPAAVTTKKWAFSGYVVDHAPTSDYTKEYSATLKIKVTGKPTLS